jgi:hypothetical protein
MHEPLLSALLRKLADGPAHDSHDPWPAIRERLSQTRAGSAACAGTASEPDGRVVAFPMRSSRRFRRLATTAVASAAAVAVLTVGLLQPWNRPSSANAAEILAGLRNEAFTMAGPVAGPMAQVSPGATCQASGVFATVDGPVPPPPGGAGVVQFGPGGPGPGTAGTPPSGTPGIYFNVGTGGPVGGQVQPGTMGGVIVGPGPAGFPPPNGTPGVVFQYRTGPGPNGGPHQPGLPPNATDMSERLGQILGISGDRVREAMRQTIAADLPPVDPLGRIATQLGVTRDQVQEAFGDPSCPGMFVIKLNASPADLSGPAAKLAVTPERLAAALAAAAPPMPPSIDSTINRLAQNLGVSPEQVRSALAQIEGPNNLYITVPGPGLPHPLGTPVPVPTRTTR